MILPQAILKVSDNTGVKKTKCLKLLGNKKRIRVGDLIVVSIVEVKNSLKIKKGDIFIAVIMRVKQNQKKKDGTRVCLNENSISLLNKQKNILATRITGPVSRDLKYSKWLKLANISITGFY